MAKQQVPATQAISSAKDYKEHVRRRIEELLPSLAQASIGDYSHNVPLTGEHDEFSELYVGIQLMLEVIREKLGQLEQFNNELEDMVAARSNELFGSETRFRAVADTANDAIITTDTQGHITYLNQAAVAIFGFPLPFIEGAPVRHLIPSLTRRYLKELPIQSTSHKQKPPKLVQTKARHERGYKFPVELSLATWHVGPKMFITAIIRDLTVHQLLVDKLAQQTNQLESKVAEQTKILRTKLAETEQNKAQNEALLSSLGEGVVAVDKSGKIFFANQEFVRIAGKSVTDVNGRPYYSVVRMEDLSGKLVPKSDRPMQHTLERGRGTFNTEYFFRTAHDTRIPVAVTTTPIILNGQTIGGIDVIRDTTKEKEVERLKSDFVSLASHQLRTPATAVKGLLSLLVDGYIGHLSPEQMSSVQEAYNENQNELNLIDDMLDVAKLDAGQMVLENSRLDLVKLIQTVAQEQQMLLQARRQTITITPLRPHFVWGDPKKLQMVFENLITNASKYSPNDSHITVKVSTQKDHICISVTDTGIGIAPGDIDKLFKRFSRATNAAQSHANGTGLGLYLAKKIIDLHHGQISVKSQLSRGSTFSVALPK